MSSLTRHPYHLVDESPWPLLAAISATGLTSGMAFYFHYQNILLIIFSFSLMILVMCNWWTDIVCEGTYQGHHVKSVELGLRMGMLLFITSEVMFFLSFFWAFFHSSLSVDIELGASWPPYGITPLDSFRIPLLNSIILLASGASVTWSHHALMYGDEKEAKNSLWITIILGTYFTFMQAQEYVEASFSFADSVYGSTFYLATGFHGLHVIIGSIFLFCTLVRMDAGNFSNNHHFGFEAAAWYWHFVDVVWLFLFVTIYWWGGA